MSIPLQREIEYPESDGKPVGETPIHGKALYDTAFLLQQRFKHDPEVYAWGNMFFYRRQGDPASGFCPDVFFVRGVSRDRPRRVYKLWEEGKAPSLIIEITSPSTKNEDLEYKRDLYQELGVEEYYLFDPFGEYLTPRLQGYELKLGHYRKRAPEADGSLLSRVTGLIFVPEGQRLRLRDAATGEPVLWPDEEADRADEEKARADAAEAKIRALEEEVARLRRERDE